MFTKEEKILAKAQQLILKDASTKEEIVEQFQSFVRSYEALLKDSKFLAKIGDRLQNRIVMTNEKLNEAKLDLEQKIKQRTAELERANQMLLAANEELDNFVYRASHDLKGPITRLLGLCQVGLLNPASGDSFYLQKAAEVAEAMDGSLELLLSINNLKKLTPDPGYLDIGTLISKAFRVAKEGIASNNLSLQVTPQDVIRVYSDARILSIMFENILSYICKSAIDANATDPEDQVIQVAISLKTTMTVNIQLSFRGVVLPIEVLDKVFHMFYRTLNHPSHTGLELYATEIAVEKIGGIVQLLKSERSETIFGVVIPKHLSTV